MNTNRLIGIMFLLALSLAAAGDHALAQQAGPKSNDANGSAVSGDEIQLSKLLTPARPKRRRPSFSLMPENRNPSLTGSNLSITPAAASPPVMGIGTLGRLTKWGGFTSSNSVIGDSTIYEDKFGKVGMGTDSPTSKLTVTGMIESKGADAGVKFPDGTVQTTSASGALLGVAHDQTLTGAGTAASPLGVASPLMVRDLDNPARQPVHFTQNPGGPAFTVPAGKRLVIEFVSGFVDVGDAVHLQDRAFFAIAFNNTASLCPCTLYLVVGDIIAVLPGVRRYGVSQMVRLYGSSGNVVELFPSSAADGQLTISGYFVDVP